MTTRRHNLEEHEVMWAEHCPDPYGGETCDQLEPNWNSYADGDKQDGDDGDQFSVFAAIMKPDGELGNGLPPGARITITVPVCPKCEMSCELCHMDDDCDFDWDEWAKNTYS